MQKRVSLTLFCFVLSCLLLDILALLVVNTLLLLSAKL